MKYKISLSKGKFTWSIQQKYQCYRLAPKSQKSKTNTQKYIKDNLAEIPMSMPEKIG